ncbi:hypothetical protein I6A84_43610 [Frankia sp. CNm7]|uniref:Uncharacterized protein n=1 Tax=Frankia nepalensis TaxID=1836974 RepID=A0A937R9G0_9ACTN|nr:hypothetical protein [Frankia nepalensis]MBL7509033.1 hypothetical protein [Frankia nepalensis]MBL7524751.1 hypothetical protein [Frankia nepalensis]MBL7627861.1 hypothetical protein [Frankia nepalensis]
MLIDGQLVDGLASTCATINPATAKALGEALTRWRGRRIDYEGGRTAHTLSARGWAALPARLG